MPVPIRRFAAVVVFWMGLLAAVVGVAQHRLWKALPWERACEYAGIAVIVSVLAWLFSRLGRKSFAGACAAVYLVALIWFAGIAPVIATLLLLLAAIGVGSALVDPEDPGRFVISLVIGIAMLAAMVGWLLPLPIHHRAIYVLILLAVIVTRRAAILAAIAPLPDQWREAVKTAPGHAGFAVLVLGLASTACWLPTMQFDDLAYHLALPWQLQTLGYYRLDAASNVWALAPWSADVLEGIVQVVAGQEGRGALNALWLCITAILSWHLGSAVGLAPRLRWLAIALLFSHPLASALLGTMQAETAGTTGLLALALSIQRAPNATKSGDIVIVGVLAAFLLSLKASMVLALIPMGAWWLWSWHGRIAWKGLPLAILLALFVGGSSYFYAAYVSGNPILPLFNSVFGSQYFAMSDFRDMHWSSGIAPGLIWQIVFDTSTYLEARDGAAGLTLVALAGAFILGVINRRTRPLALVGAACFLLPLSQVQYLRYAHPAIALIIPTMLAGTAMAAGRRLVTISIIALCAANIAFYANAKWMLASGALSLRVTSGQAAVLARYAPERAINAYVRDHDPAGRSLVLFAAPGSVFAAELGGRGVVTNWYDRQLSQLRPICEADPSGGKWRGLFKLVGATYVEVRSADMSAALQTALDTSHARLVQVSGPIELWRLPAQDGGDGAFMAKRNIAKFLFSR